MDALLAVLPHVIWAGVAILGLLFARGKLVTLRGLDAVASAHDQQLHMMKQELDLIRKEVRAPITRKPNF